MIVAAVGVAGVAGAGGLFGWRRHQVAAHFQAIRVEGLAAAKSGDFPLAVTDLRQYLARFGDDVEALAEYCRVRPKVPSADRSHLRETMQALRYYVSLKPDAVEQRRALLNLYLTYNLNTEALDSADRLLATHADDPELLSAKTQALARLRRNAEALAAAERWAKAAPLDFTAQQTRVELLKAGGKDDESILKDADALVAAHPKSVGMRLVRARALFQANRIEEGVATLKETEKLPDASPAEMRSLATMMDQAGMFDESVGTLTRLSAVEDPDRESNHQNHLFLARRLWERGDNKGFLAFVEKYPDTLVDQPDLLAIHGLLLRASGEQAKGDADLAKLEADASTPIAKAWSTIVGSSGTAMTIAGAKKQIELLNDALIDRPSDPYLLYFVGEAYAKSGDPELAISLFQRASRNAPAWAVPPMRASNLLAAQNRFAEALQLAGMAASRSQRIALPNYIQMWTAAVEAGQRNDGADLLKLIDEAIAQTTGQGWLHVARATVLCRLNRQDEARAEISANLKDQKAGLDQTALLRLAALSRIHKLSLDEAIEARLRADFGVTADGGTTTFFRVFLAEGKDAALAGFEKARAAAKPDAREWMLADARVRDFLRDPKAEASWHQALAAYPDDLELVQAAVASSTLWRDRPTIDRLIEQLSTLSAERGTNWRLLRARWLIEGSTDAAPDLVATQKASDLLTAVLLTTPENVSARFWQARAQIRLGNRGSAIENVLAATRLAPRSTPIALYAARLLQEQGDFVRAREQLDRLNNDDLNDPEQSSLAAQLLAQQGLAQQAIELLEQSRSLGTSEQSDLLLAILYNREGSYEKTEAIISRLMQRPTLSAIAFAADYFGSRGKSDVADQTLQKLYSIDLAPGVREMTLADYHLRRGDVVDAQKFGEAATIASPQNVAAWRVLLLSEIAAGKNDAATATLDKAKAALPADPYVSEMRSPDVWPLVTQVNGDLFRPLATRLVADPKSEGIRQALTLLKNAKGDAAAKSLVDGMRQLAAQFPLAQPIQVVSAQVLMSAGQNDEAAAVAMKAVQAFPTDGSLPRLAAQALLNSGQWSQARTFAQVWREKAGADVLPADLLTALADIQLRDPADAEARLRPHVSYALDRMEQHGDVVQTFAVALYQQGKALEGQKVVEQAITRRPAFASQWLSSAAVSLSTPDAMAWFQQLDAKLVDAKGRALATRVLLQLALRPDGSPEARSQLPARLASLEKESDLDRDSLTMLGVIADQIDQDEIAERFYRRAVANGGGQPVVWNNLAMLLLGQNKASGEAESLAARAVEAAPGVPVFRDTYAQVLLAANHPDDARAAIAPAVKQEPQNPLWKLTSAEIAVAAGHRDEAKSLLDEVESASGVREALGDAEQKRLKALREKLGQMPLTGATNG